MLLPYASFGSEDTVLTLALALPAIAAVAVDRVLRRSPGAAVGEDRASPAAAASARPPAASPPRR